MTLRVLIADDEPLARQRLQGLFRAEPEVEVVGEAADGRAALAAIRRACPDLVFLDVRLPELDGFGVMALLADQPLPVFILVTAYDQFAVRAFEARAADYLLKPFDRARFQQALRRGRERVSRARGGAATAQLAALLEGLRARAAPSRRLAIKSGRRVLLLPPEEIDWVRGASNYVELHAGKATHLLRQSLGTLERQLQSHRFLRLSRSLLVNLDRVVECRPKAHGDFFVLLRDGTRLVASRNYRERLCHLLA